ncbi:hypothetical protein ABW21_db0208227 [Orbilia brochopaga]|nr:hypothetical protein ABW21_db0208227 [Drechslerella brochopaga]
MRLHNSSLTPTAPLRFPMGVAGPELPTSARDLRRLTVARCIPTAAALGLPPLAGSPHVDERRRQIAEYLGACID